MVVAAGLAAASCWRYCWRYCWRCRLVGQPRAGLGGAAVRCAGREKRRRRTQSLLPWWREIRPRALEQPIMRVDRSISGLTTTRPIYRSHLPAANRLPPPGATKLVFYRRLSGGSSHARRKRRRSVATSCTFLWLCARRSIQRASRPMSSANIYKYVHMKIYVFRCCRCLPS